MKKLVLVLVAMFLGLYGIQAAISTTKTNESSELELKSTSSTTYYEGPAWSASDDGYIPKAKDRITIKWTSDGLWINGESSDLQVYRISEGRFLIRVDGSSKHCTHYINLGGERYFFVCG